LRPRFAVSRLQQRAFAIAVMLGAPVALVPTTASAEGLFDFFFGGAQKQQQRQGAPQPNFFDPFGLTQQSAPPPPSRPVASSGSGPAFCVRSCDGRYFPLMRGNASPVQMCQAFCPATATKVFFGSNIDSAYAAGGERYADSENAYAYRKALRADCTCNGRDPAGLAPVDLSLDSSLHAGDVIATSNGLVAYSGIRTGNDQTPEFTPVASYPGLTAEVRTRLGEMKVAPVRAEMVANDAATSTDITSSIAPTPRVAPSRDKRAVVE
jgi:Protein of unknown function (DUF2865)